MLLKKKPKLPVVFKWILWMLTVQFILGNISAAIYAYKFTHFFKDADNWNIANAKNVFDKTWKLFKGPEYGKDGTETPPPFPVQPLHLSLSNGKKINAWYTNDKNSKGVICLFHGLTSNKSYYAHEAAYFKEEGYNVFMLDFRGHGTSDGMATTIGYDEAEEVKLAFDFLKANGEKKIYLFGGSMGAVAVARAVAHHRLSPAAIILEMPFDGLVDHLKARGRSFGFPESTFAIPVTFWVGIENSFPAFQHKTSAYAKNISCPVLLQCGTNDHLVKNEETHRIFRNLRSKNKKLVLYEDAVHSSLLKQDPLKWDKEVMSFISTYN